MSKGVNKVFLIGRLGTDPEVRYTATGIAVARFNLATGEAHNDKDGNRQEKTEWHRIVVWKKLAEIAGKYLTKGRLVYIEGSLQTTSWEKDGVKRYTTEIVARDLQMLDSAANNSAGNNRDEREPGEPGEDDFPF